MNANLKLLEQIWLTLCKNKKFCFFILMAMLLAMAGYLLNHRFYFIDPKGYVSVLIDTIVGTPFLTLPFYFLYRKEHTRNITDIQLFLSKWKSLLITFLLLLLSTLPSAAYQTFLNNYITLYERIESITILLSWIFSCSRYLSLLINILILPYQIAKSAGIPCRKLQIRAVVPTYLIFAVIYLLFYILSDIAQYELLYEIPCRLISTISFFLLTLTFYRAMYPIEPSDR